MQYSASSPWPQPTLFIHDRSDIGPPLSEFLAKSGYPNRHLSTHSDIIQLLNGTPRLDRFPVVVIHKDLGEHTAPLLIDAIEPVINHIHELSPLARIVIMSGEFPDGKNHVLQLRADGYMSPPGASGPEINFLIAQIESGWVMPPELERRGRSVTTPREAPFFPHIEF